MSQVLYRKWRPQTWDEVIGQDHIIQTIRNAVRAERTSHAYLFAGPRGTGKTTTARLLAKAVNCLTADPQARPCNECEHCQSINAGRFLDIIEIDAASNTSVDDVRDLRERINFSPNKGRYKVYIIDEVHMLSTAAFNALLKTLEEPPAHAIFVLATTEVHKIPATVLSRCQRHEFRRLPVGVMVDYLRKKTEEDRISIEAEAVETIARQATGSLRDAISLLDQLASMGEKVTQRSAQEILGTAAAVAVQEMVTSLAEADLGRGLTLLNQALDAGADPRQFGRQVVDYMRALLLLRLGSNALVEADPELQATMRRQAEQLETEQLLEAIRLFSEAALGTRASPQPGLPLELALVEAGSRAGTAPARAQPSPDPEVQSSSGRQSQGPASADPQQAAPPGEQPPPQDVRPEGPAASEGRSASSIQTGTSKGDRTVPPARADEALAAGDPTLSFEQVLAAWPELLAVARRRDAKSQALLNSSKPLGLEAGRLILGFGSDLLREKMEKGHNLSTLAASLEEVFRQKVGIRCVLMDRWGDRTDKDGAALPLEEGGMVATALRDLGAQVVDVEPVQGESDDPNAEEEEE